MCIGGNGANVSALIVYFLFSSVTNLSVHIHEELLSNQSSGSTHTAMGHSH
jgi:hypothetical protein